MPSTTCIRCSRCGKSKKATKAQRQAAAAGKDVYCSRDCQKAANLVTLPCAYEKCPKIVTRRRAEVPESGRVFCDDTCRDLGAVRVRRGRTIPCAVCADPVYVIPALEGKKRTCSDECRREDAKRDQVTRNCDYCGTEYTRSASQVGRFCTKEHADAHAHGAGKGYLNSDGYRVKSVNGQPKLEHRLIAADRLGRDLATHEQVHHVNGVRHDNRVDGPFRVDENGRLRSGNLEIWSTSQPAGQEIGPKVDYALDLLELYREHLSAAEVARLVAVATRHTVAAA